MQNGFFIIALLCISLPGLKAQSLSPADTIGIRHGLFETFSYQSRRVSTARELQHILLQLDDPHSQQLVRQAKYWNRAGQAAGITGGVLMGYALSEENLNLHSLTPLFYYGLGLALGSYLLQHRANQKFFGAASRYNFVLRHSYGLQEPGLGNTLHIGWGIRF